jgi:hypothetical protein
LTFIARCHDRFSFDGSARQAYVFSDSFTSDGWGAWLGRTKLVLQR